MKIPEWCEEDAEIILKAIRDSNITSNVMNAEMWEISRVDTAYLPRFMFNMIETATESRQEAKHMYCKHMREFDRQLSLDSVQ